MSRTEAQALAGDIVKALPACYTADFARSVIARLTARALDAAYARGVEAAAHGGHLVTSEAIRTALELSREAEHAVSCPYPDQVCSCPKERLTGLLERLARQ